MIKEPMFISPRTFRGYEQYKTDCARASGWNEAMAFIFAEELETERSRTIREKFFVVENVQTERSEQMTINDLHMTEEQIVNEIQFMRMWDKYLQKRMHGHDR